MELFGMDIWTLHRIFGGVALLIVFFDVLYLDKIFDWNFNREMRNCEKRGMGR